MNPFLQGVLYALLVGVIIVLALWNQHDRSAANLVREETLRDLCLVKCAKESGPHRTAFINAACYTTCNATQGPCFTDCRNSWVFSRNYSACCTCRYANGSQERLRLNMSWDTPHPHVTCGGGA